jgi:hypothetical protein
MSFRPPEPFIFRAPHHLYYGAAFALFAGFMKYMCAPWPYYALLDWIWYPLAIIGIYLVVDDIIEHTITKDTPARIIWEKVVFPLITTTFLIL